MAGVRPSDMGELFAIQPTGDLALTDFETQSWFCYRPRRDVLVPVPMESQVRKLSTPINPFISPRPINVLYRFSAGGAPGTATFRTDPHNYSRTDLRTALLQQHALNPIPGSVAGPATLEQTHIDMRQSVFCVCPNGISQHTLRVFRAILAGCIPVTFFRAFDSPLERNLGLDWSTFSVNINPDEHALTQPTLMRILGNVGRVRAMQAALMVVQPFFEWGSGRHDGVEQNLLRELNLLLDINPALAAR